MTAPLITPDTHRTLYLSGPITHQPDLNRPTFAAAALRLRHMGYTVVSPHELMIPISASWEVAMRLCLRALMLCDAVAVLPGWRLSRGAALECDVAGRLAMPIVDATTLQRAWPPDLAREGI